MGRLIGPGFSYGRRETAPTVKRGQIIQYVINKMEEKSETFIYLYEHFQCGIDQHDSSVLTHNEGDGWFSLAVPHSFFRQYIC